MFGLGLRAGFRGALESVVCGVLSGTTLSISCRNKFSSNDWPVVFLTMFTHLLVSEAAFSPYNITFPAYLRMTGMYFNQDRNKHKEWNY